MYFVHILNEISKSFSYQQVSIKLKLVISTTNKYLNFNSKLNYNYNFLVSLKGQVSE